MALGMVWEDVAADYESFDVWPDNYTSVGVFNDIRTQWRVGPRGPYGLDYSAIPSVLEMNNICRDDWPDIFWAIQTMESAALEELNS